MSEQPDILNDIRKDIVKEIKTHKLFSNIPVITEELGDVENEVEIAIEAMGLVVVLETMTGKVDNQNMGSDAMSLQTIFTVKENVMLNRGPAGTGKTASMAVVNLIAIFSPSRTKALPCYLNDFTLVNDTDGQLIYQLIGTTKAGWTLTE